MDKKKKKNLFIAFIILFVLIDLVLVYFAFFKKKIATEKEYKNEHISFTYTSDYTIKEVNSNKISIGKDKKSGQIDIIITELSDEVLKRDYGFIIDEAKNDFENNNDNYFMDYYGEYETENYIFKDFLYSNETNNKQIDLNYLVYENKLILITYVNEDKYFDLYESNVLDIIDSIKVS